MCDSNSLNADKTDKKNFEKRRAMQLLFYFIYGLHLFSILLHLIRRRARNSTFHLFFFFLIFRNRPINFFFIQHTHTHRKRERKKKAYYLLVDYKVFRLFLLLGYSSLLNLISHVCSWYISPEKRRTLIRSRE